MANVLAVSLGVLAFGILCCAWRAWAIFRTCVPAAANVVESSYTAQLREQDAPWGFGWYNRGKPGIRFIHDQVQFEDHGGKSRTGSVSRWVSRSYPPYETYVVWYDPTGDRVTANGPGYWSGFSAVLAFVFAASIVCAVQISDARGHALKVAQPTTATR
jgi:hypothetical protein